MNLSQLNGEALPILICVALVLHLIFFMWGKKLHVLFLLVGILGMVTNMSISARYEHVVFVKYLRIYLNVAIIVLGLVLYRKRVPGLATTFLLLTALMYWISGSWSVLNPMYYLAYNSFFFISVLAGISLANSITSMEQLYAGLRVFGVIGTIAGAFYITMYFVNPGMVVVQGRLASLGGIASTFSADCACFAIPLIYLAFHDPKKSLMPLWCLGAALLILCILLSGSRTGLLLVFSGLMVILYVNRKKPIITGLAITSVLLFLIFFAASFEDFTALRRVISVRNTRAEVWERTLYCIQYIPVYGSGSGFFYGPKGLTASNPHNCLIKIVHNCGFIGLILFLTACGLFFVKFCRLIRVARRDSQQRPMITFIVAMTFAVFLHLMPDHSIVAATSISAVWIGFVFAITDRIASHPIQQPRLRKVLVRTVDKRLVSFGHAR